MQRFLIFILVLLVLLPAGAQETGNDDEIGSDGEAVEENSSPEIFPQDPPPSLALLIQGPLFLKGIPFLDPNGLEAYTGRYTMGNEEVVVYFTGEPLIIPEEWEKIRCEGADYLVFPYNEGTCYFIEKDETWAAFIYFKHPDSDHCRFLYRFYNRLNYFMQISSTFSFPAVIELE